jgi:glycerol-3-phosphate dehydrogenase
MTLGMVSGAAAAGAAAANYVEATSMRTENGRVTGLTVRDLVGDNTLEVQARAVANCAGPWIGAVNGSALGRARGPATAMSRGSHAVLRGLGLPCAIGLPTKFRIEGVAGRGGRHMFLIPWREHVLLGTSYASHDSNIDDVEPTVEDLRQLIEGVNGAAGREVIGPDNIVHAFAGLYPLTTDNVRTGVYQGSGDYAIIDHAQTDGIAGYYSVAGAKFTTARLLAEKACDAIAASLGERFGPCQTKTKSIPAGAIESLDGLVDELEQLDAADLGRPRIEQLARLYGTDAKAILGIVKEQPELGQPLAADRETIGAEAVYCARHELICRLGDFIFRRTGLGTLGRPESAAISTSARLIGAELGWSGERVTAEADTVLSRFARLEKVRSAL